MMKKRIAVLMAGLDKEYQQEFSFGMAEAATLRDVDICIFNCQGQAEENIIRNDGMESEIFDLPDLKRFDGVIALCYTMVSQKALEHVRRLIADLDDVPLVTIDTSTGTAVEVTFDDEPSVREIVEHLIHAHGCRSFALVTGPLGNQVAVDRRSVSCQVLMEHGCELRSEHEGFWTRDGGRMAGSAILADPHGLPDAVVCGNDDMAFGVIEAFSRAGIRVPEDVKITGFDALQEAIGRGLTTISRPAQEAGKVSVNILADWMAGKEPENKLLVLPTRMILGGSCGCPGDPAAAQQYMRTFSESHRHVERNLARASAFSSSLAGVSGQEEAGKVIANFAASWAVKDMHVCVAPDFLSPDGGTREFNDVDSMLLLSSYSNGQEAPQTVFSISELLPRLSAEHQRPATLVFSPLYYLEKNFGYAVFDLQHATGFELYSVLTLLGGALMSLNLKCTVRAYATALEDMSIHDPLTGLYNRRGYNQLAPRLFAEAQTNGRCFAIISCDMDGMKTINDEYGHMAGDTAIRRMGTALRVLEDEGITCVHISGDEFIAFGFVQDSKHAAQLGENIHAAIDDLNHRERWICDIGASVGTFAAVPREDEALDDFLIRADGAMYRNKRSRKRDARD